MIYQIAEGIKPKLLRLKILGIGLLAVGLTFAASTSYAHSIGIQFNPTTLGKNAAMIASSSKSTSAAKSKTLTHTPGVKAGGASAGSIAAMAAAAGVSSTSCTGLFGASHSGLSGASSPELRKLAQYEQVCGGALADRSSFFLPTPTTTGAAAADASDAASTLKEYASFGIKPLVFFEPSTDAGGNIDLAAYAAGAYDSALDAYFASLKADGVTDAMMGMWVAIPEGNIPVWTTTDPGVYTSCVTRSVQFQKKYFPGSQATIMLDSESYSSGASWGSGHYSSLLPYVQNIPKGLLDSFGLQGFPWAPAANVSGQASLYDAHAYLRADFAAEAAHSLGTSNIWFNTGTFNQMYTNNSAQTVTASPAVRQAMLNGVLAQSKSLQGQGFNVSVHLFAEDKSSVSEAIDWSYWKTTPGTDANTAVFTSFVHDAHASNISLWLFDSAEH